MGPGFYYHSLCFIIFLQSFWTGIALPHHLCNSAYILIHMYYYLHVLSFSSNRLGLLQSASSVSSCSLRCLVNSFKLFHALSMKKRPSSKKKKKKRLKKANLKKKAKKGYKRSVYTLSR